MEPVLVARTGSTAFVRMQRLNLHPVVVERQIGRTAYCVALGPLQHLLCTARPQGAGAGLQGVDNAVIADAVHTLLAVLVQALAGGLRCGGHLPPGELIRAGAAHRKMQAAAADITAVALPLGSGGQVRGM